MNKIRTVILQFCIEVWGSTVTSPLSDHYGKSYTDFTCYLGLWVCPSVSVKQSVHRPRSEYNSHCADQNRITKLICSNIRKWTHKRKIIRHRVCLCVSSQEVFNRFWWSLEVFFFRTSWRRVAKWGCNFTSYPRQQVEVAYELYASAALYPGERAPVIILMGLHEFESRSGRFTEKKNLLSVLRSVSRRVKLW